MGRRLSHLAFLEVHIDEYPRDLTAMRVLHAGILCNVKLWPVIVIVAEIQRKYLALPCGSRVGSTTLRECQPALSQEATEVAEKRPPAFSVMTIEVVTLQPLSSVSRLCPNAVAELMFPTSNNRCLTSP